MATALSIDLLFEAAVKIQVLHEKTVQLSFTEHGIFIKFPTTRRLAEFLDVPHYYVLPFFAMMEEDGLVTRAERVGIATTRKGTTRFLAIVNERYRSDAEKLLGTALLSEILSAAHKQEEPT
jgi:DNA-binding transcriptional regulator YhcF (GntR family)